MPEKLTKDMVEIRTSARDRQRLVYDSEVRGFGVRVVAPTDRHPRGARSFFLNYTFDGTERRYHDRPLSRLERPGGPRGGQGAAQADRQG